MLVQFAQMGAAFAGKRYGIERPRVALLSIGEEKSKGTPLEKETYALLADGEGGPDFDFVGNVEGRDFFTGLTDVIVTDGFTGNVALKTLEGSMRFLDRGPDRDPGASRRHARPPTPSIPTCSRWPPPSIPRTPAGPCCSASTASA